MATATFFMQTAFPSGRHDPASFYRAGSSSLLFFPDRLPTALLASALVVFPPARDRSSGRESRKIALSARRFGQNAILSRPFRNTAFSTENPCSAQNRRKSAILRKRTFGVSYQR
jgi:hypothetical protein